MAYLDHYLDKRNERLQRKHKAPARVIRGDRRERVVGEVMDVLKDWRFSHFENEAPCRYGLRAALCMAGLNWPTADVEADLVVQEALSLIGAERPSWAEGQWHHTTPRENCSWCGDEMDEENRTRGQRFCSSMCAKSALEKRVFGEHAESQAIQTSAYRLIKKEKSAPKPCAHCGKCFRNWRKETIYCSAKCVAQAKPNVVPHIDCITCGTNFHPQRLGIQCCSLVCSGKYRAEQYRAAYPERACACCRALFRPSKPFGIYCSRACAHRVGNRKKQAARRSNVIYLTAEIFDGWFKRAA